MVIVKGDKLFVGELVKLGENGLEIVKVQDLIGKVVIFVVLGVYMLICSNSYMFSFVKNVDKFCEKGVLCVICVIVNDFFVVGVWLKLIGVGDVGIEVLVDVDGSWIKVFGMNIEGVGWVNGCLKCYVMLVDGGVVIEFQVEESFGVCIIFLGELLLDLV